MALLGAPEGPRALLEPLPPGARVSARLSHGLDVMVLFADRAADLVCRMPRAQAAKKPDACCGSPGPSAPSGVTTDLTEDVVREMGLAAGLVDTKDCAIDATWSGVRPVIRPRDRP